uniref:ALG11_N domain-containing protein n=1 Tax=Mesocestoides corti TaxID=53468 RepID=A0A5K3EPE8_MESCO
MFVLALLQKRRYLKKQLSRQHKLSSNPILLSFFHPYCNSGGGGERVLWVGISTLLQHHQNLLIFIYTNDSECLKAPKTVFSRIKNTFDISIEDYSRVKFIPLYSEVLLRPVLYPCLTLVGQAIGSVIAALEAVARLPCDVFLDTTGFAFSIPIFSWLIGASCGAYVHFPTVSSDMEKRLISREPDDATSYNNSERIRRSLVLTTLKRLYYALFKIAYGWVGSSTNCRQVAVNSSWTLRHIAALFGSLPFLLYPPCPCLTTDGGNGRQRKPWIISIGQFRPEKNHQLSDQ